MHALGLLRMCSESKTQITTKAGREQGVLCCHGRLNDWSVAKGCLDGGLRCILYGWMEAEQAGKSIHNVHGAARSNNGTHFTHARLKVAPHRINGPY